MFCFSCLFGFVCGVGGGVCEYVLCVCVFVFLFLSWFLIFLFIFFFYLINYFFLLYLIFMETSTWSAWCQHPSILLFCFVLFCFVLFCFVLFCFVFVFVLSLKIFAHPIICKNWNSKNSDSTLDYEVLKCILFLYWQ